MSRALIEFLRLVGVPLLAAALGFVAHTNAGLEHEAAATITLAVWMGGWWLTEAIDVRATALLPLVLMPLLDIAPLEDAAAPYASPLVYLFLGGFLLGLAMQRWQLDRRIAHLTLVAVGERPAAIVAGFMGATAVMSAFVSNTATAIIMLPIATGVAARVVAAKEADRSRFGRGLLLGIAYAASIGGVATIIGSPPNGFLAQFFESELGRPVSFVNWMLVGAPIAALLLPFAWWFLVRRYVSADLHLEGGRDALRRELAELGTPSTGERVTFVVFLAAVAAWLSRPLLTELVPGLTDAGIAMTAGVLLFVIPVDVRERTFVLEWRDLDRLPWGVLVLFGGGLSLARAVNTTGVDAFLGSGADALAGLPAFFVVLVVTGAIVFLTELTSNTATAATLVPILAAVAPALGLDPAVLAVPATLGASCAFMMPVATPPNAIVFSSGLVPIAEMRRAGMVLNLVAWGLIALMGPKLATWLG